MSRKLLVLLPLALVLWAPGRAGAAENDKSYEAIDKESVDVTNVKAILLPFVATCEDKTTRFKRLFCSALNERLKAQHQTKVYSNTVAPSDAGPLVVSFRAQPKPVMSLQVKGCLTCAEPMLEKEGGDVSKGRFFMFKMPRDIKVKRGKVLYDFVDIDVLTKDIELPPKTTEKQFKEDILPFLRLDLNYRPVAGVTQVGRRHKYGVVNFELLGFRVFDKCSGKVYAADPAARGDLPPDKTDLTCPANRPKKATGPVLPATLPQEQVKELMDLVGGDVRACYEQFGVRGDVPVDVVVEKSGKVKEAKVTGRLQGTPTAQCVERLVRNAKFPEFKGQDARLQWPFTLK